MHKDNSTIAEHTPRPGAVSHYTLAFTTPARRPGSLALYALNRALDSARDGNDPGVARLKLQWWRDELQHLQSGKPRHPITLALRENGLESPSDCTGLVASRERELAHQDIASWDDFLALARLGIGQSLELWSRLLGQPADPSTHSSLTALATGLQFCTALTRCHRAALRGHSTLPLESPELGTIDPQQLSCARPDAATQLSLVRAAERGMSCLERALDEWPEPLRSMHLPMLITAKLRQQILSLQIEDGFCRLDQRVTMTPLRKLWHAWRMSRRYHR